MSKRITNQARGPAADKIEAAIEPIERMDLLINSAQHNFRDREIEPHAANRVEVALDMLESEITALRRTLYGEALGP